jgi:hypothetical protein
VDVLEGFLLLQSVAGGWALTMPVAVGKHLTMQLLLLLLLRAAG